MSPVSKTKTALPPKSPAAFQRLRLWLTDKIHPYPEFNTPNTVWAQTTQQAAMDNAVPLEAAFGRPSMKSHTIIELREISNGTFVIVTHLNMSDRYAESDALMLFKASEDPAPITDFIARLLVQIKLNLEEKTK